MPQTRPCSEIYYALFQPVSFHICPPFFGHVSPSLRSFLRSEALPSNELQPHFSAVTAFMRRTFYPLIRFFIRSSFALLKSHIFFLTHKHTRNATNPRKDTRNIPRNAKSRTYTQHSPQHSHTWPGFSHSRNLGCYARMITHFMHSHSFTQHHSALRAGLAPSLDNLSQRNGATLRNRAQQVIFTRCTLFSRSQIYLLHRHEY